MDSILYAQAGQLLSALRKAMASSKAMGDDHSLHSAVDMLEELSKMPILSKGDLPAPKLLQPFIECLKSQEMSGPLVLITVESIRRLIDNGILEDEYFQSGSSRPDFLLTLTKALNGTRFEASEASTDEVSLFELLELIKDITLGSKPWVNEMSGVAMVLCIETLLTYLMPRFSELLKRTAENSLVSLTRSIFSRYDKLERDEEHFHIQIPGRKPSDTKQEAPSKQQKDSPVSESESGPSTPAAEGITTSIKPCSRGLCDALIDIVGRILHSSDKKQADRFIPVAIKMASTIFEAGGLALLSDPITLRKLNEPLIKEVVRQFCQGPNPTSEMFSSLIILIFAKYRHHLHGHFAFFINHLLSLAPVKSAGNVPVASPGRSPRPFPRDAFLDIFFFVGKQVERQSCRKAIQTISNLSKHIAEGCAALKSNDDGTGKQLHDKRSLKMTYAKAAAAFNDAPKDIEGFLVSNNLLSPEHTREDLARQVRKLSEVNKKKLGEWLAKPGNEDLARAFIADLDLRGKRIDDALRLMLATFRLPGESQEINRIMEAFAPVLYEQNSADPGLKAIFANVDSVYIMAYSVIMLNTDQHNPQYKGRRMTEDDFVRNNRGNNDGKDYDHGFLRQVYQSIRNNEILMPDEHEGDTAFNYRFSETVNISNVYYPGERSSVEMSLVAGEIFLLVWDPFLKSLTDFFELQLAVANEHKVAKSAISGLSDLASSANSLNLPARMDELISGVWSASNIERYFKSSSGMDYAGSNIIGNAVPRYLSKVENGRELVRLLVEIFKRHGEVVRTGWKQLVDLVFILHESRVISSESFAPRADAISKRKPSSPNSDSILASLTNYLYSAESAPSSPALTPAEADNVSRVTEFLSATCHFEDIFQESRMLSTDALSSMLSAFLSIASPSVQVEWSRNTRALSIDICIYCAMQNRDRLGAVWSVLFAGLSDVALRGSDDVLREHAVIGLGRLGLKMAEREEVEVREHLLEFLQFLCNLPQDAFDKISEPILAILLKIVELDTNPGRKWRLLRGSDVWPSYFTIMSLVSRHRQCAPYTLGLLMASTTDECQPLFPLEFFSEFLDLLSSFISACAHPPPGDASNLPVSPIDMAKTAIKRLCDLEGVMRHNLQMSDHLSFTEYILPIHSAIAMQCCHPSREVRQHALVSLQRMVMGRVGWRKAEELVNEFDMVLFTLLEELQSEAISALNGTIEDTQMGAASLVSKIYLNNIQTLKQGDPEVLSKTLLTLLTKLLGFLKFRSETLREGIPETVKNVLFVLTTSSNGDGSLLGESEWKAVWELTDQVFPDLKKELVGPTEPIPGPGSVISNDNDNHDRTIIQQVASPSAIHYV